MQRDRWNEIVELHLGEQDLRFGHYDDCAPECTSTHEIEDSDDDSEFADDADFAYDGDEFAGRFFE